MKVCESLGCRSDATGTILHNMARMDLLPEHVGGVRFGSEFAIRRSPSE
jgi:hypothetical protein